MNAEHISFDTANRGVKIGDAVSGAPILLHLWDGRESRQVSVPYSSWHDRHGDAEVMVGEATVRVSDDWNLVGDVVTLDRSIAVGGAADGGFATEVRLGVPGSMTASRLFLPGTQYGDPDRANPLAIAGQSARSAGDTCAYIREDRLPAPVAALQTTSGMTLQLLNPNPDGSTVEADAVDTVVVPVIDEGLRFGALSVADSQDRVALGFVYPGLEGPTTYQGDTFPDGQIRAWRHRYHPLTDGSTYSYRVQWRLGGGLDWPALVTDTWRWAWHTLQPAVDIQDLDQARRALFDQLADSVLEVDGRAGFPHFRDAVSGQPYIPAHRQADHALMGFTGRSTDCAYYLLREAHRIQDTEPERAAKFRHVGEVVLDSFAQLPSSPPEGEGFDIRTGAIVPAAPHQARDDVMLLRGLTEGAKSMFRGWREATDAGEQHSNWERWARELTDWILGQQRPDGSIPRAWKLGTTQITDPSGYSTFNAVSLFVEAFRAIGDEKYLSAAVAAGDFVWNAGQSIGVFVGGTLDNPDVIDKEAGTLSLEGYLGLYETTGDDRWLVPAKAAADYAETWIYIWAIPLLEQFEHGQGWKPGVTTVGAQLIASGHSLVDQYMAFDAGNYAKLGVHTGDNHYTDVARILLHNTKVMLSVPDHPFDLAGPGWQQEHWSFAPYRGEGLHRGWLPWVTCAHIEGIAVLEDFDPELYRHLAQKSI